MKVINDLLNINNMKIVQDTDYFNFSLDSVLLSNYVEPKKDDKIIDFCSGNCPVPMILTTKTKEKIYAVEIQKEVYKLGLESIKLNKLDKQIELLNMDVKDVISKFNTDSFDIITCNPPYFKTNEMTKQNDNEIKRIARHEICITLDDIFKVSKKLLKNNGKIVMIHRPERLEEIFKSMKDNNITPKIIQFIYPKEGQNSNMIIIEGRKNARKGIKVLPPIIVHSKDNEYRDDIKKMFGGD
ncbi:MAG: tRNA1(Val) (adenine(37)-N6)-methyltransferase [Bacilli bacterium]|nr:tRNA1(Val) (adenine(37)-N6)-methyltransferase [Bacilli bacterium]